MVTLGYVASYGAVKGNEEGSGKNEVGSFEPLVNAAARFVRLRSSGARIMTTAVGRLVRM